MERKIFNKWIMTLVITLVVSILVLGKNNDQLYPCLSILPFCFLIGTLVFNKLFSAIFENIGVLFVEILFAVRMVVIPFFMAITIDMVRSPSTSSMFTKAVFLQCYEYLFIMLVLWCAHVSSKKRHSIHEKNEIYVFFNPGMAFSLCIVAMTIFVVGVWLLVPSSRNLYSSIFHFSDVDFTTVAYSTGSEAVGSLTRSILTLFKMAFDIVRILFPMFIILKIRKKYGYSHLGVAISLLFCVLQLLFIPSTTARAVISAFLLLYFTTKVYPEIERKFLTYTILGTVGVILAYFYIRFTVGSRYGTTGLEYISNILTAYFGGINNIASGFNIPKGHEVSAFWGSLYSAIPFNSTLFGLKVETLQNFFNAANNSYGQITPMISEGCYYFGSAFAPVFSAIFALVAYRYGQKQNVEINPWMNICYLFIAIMSAISIVMYNEQIIVVWFTNWLIPMTLIAAMTKGAFNIEKNRNNNIA